MRFIHTADWHLGNQMHDIDRHEEVLQFLNWLKNQIIEKKAEALVISGDIFDTVNPSVEARRFYYSFLASLVGTCCHNIIIVGGNHDSAVLLDSAKQLLEVLDIRVVGSINNLSAEDMVFELFDGDKNAIGICIASPFVRETELRNLLDDSDIEDCDLFSVAYKQFYENLYEAAEKLRAGRNIPVIATGHLYARDLEGRLNGVASNVKSDDGVKVLDVLGTLGNVPSSVFPPVDYVALGHIHYATTVAGNPAIRYSGSPFVMGFDEAEINHYVLCVDVEQGSAPCVEKLETPTAAVFRRIEGTLGEIKERLSAFCKFSPKKPVYLELCYKRDIGSNAYEFLSDAIAALPENVHIASWKIAEQENHFSATGFDLLDAEEVKNLDDQEVFSQLILAREGLSPDSDEAKAVLEKFLPLFLQIAGE